MEEFEKIDREVAENDFLKLLEFAEVDWDLYCMHEGRTAELDKASLIRAIENRKLVIDEDGKPTLYTKKENEKLKKIVIPEFYDIFNHAADKVKGDKERATAILSAWLKIDRGLLKTLKPKDRGILERLWVLFLGD